MMIRNRTIAVVNQKGGVAKSTIASHMAYAALDAGLRVLLVDLDRQGSLSLSFPAIEGEAAGMKASQLFTHEVPGQLERISDQLSIIRADKKELQDLTAEPGMEWGPKRHLSQLSQGFDLTIIDTPGSIGFNPPMTVGALLAATAVVCPFKVGFYEADALNDLWEYLKAIKTPGYNPELRLLGLLPSRINTKSPEEVQALKDVREQLGSLILPHVLVERAAVGASIAKRRPVWKGTRGASHLAAGREMYAACNHILGMLKD